MTKKSFSQSFYFPHGLVREDGAKFDLILAAEANYCEESSAKVSGLPLNSSYVFDVFL